MFGGMIDEAIELAKKPANEVLFAYCGGINDICIYINQNGSKHTCKFCSRCTERVLKQYGIKTVSLKNYKVDSRVSLCYTNATELRNLTYRGVQIGLSIMSSYISATRNQKPFIDEQAKKYFDVHVAQNIAFVDALYKLIEDFKPEMMYTFNGRFEEVRPIYDISKTIGIPCILTEVFKKNGIWYKARYDNRLPHDIKYNVERREYCWSHYEMTDEEKEALGHSFYKKRRGGEESGDVKIYIANQVEGNISCFDKSKRNIAIFNSSEDEFAAVGGDWDLLRIFPNQFEGIKYLLENAPKDIHFILRVHPNLKEIPYKFHKELYELPNHYDNITVIPADSNASTYTIMENCEKVICFGSTMGVESSYWGKPAILLGPSIYYYDDVVYIPKDKESIIDMLSKRLEPKWNDNLIKLGAYILNKDPLIIPAHTINCDVNYHTLFGHKFSSNPFINFFGNEYLTGLFIAINRMIKEKQGRFTLPKEEE